MGSISKPASPIAQLSDPLTFAADSTAFPPARHPVDDDLLIQTHSALGLNQRELAELLEISLRTVQRWAAGRSSPAQHDWHAMARAVHPVDPVLAERLAAAGGSSLAALGFVPPPVPPPVLPPAPPPVIYDPRHLADGVVCAAAESADLSPQAIRMVLLAAFRRAREMRLTVEEMERALTPEGSGKNEPTKQ